MLYRNLTSWFLRAWAITQFHTGTPRADERTPPPIHTTHLCSDSVAEAMHAFGNEWATTLRDVKEEHCHCLDAPHAGLLAMAEKKG
jgi:hypothetical protein